MIVWGFIREILILITTITRIFFSLVISIFVYPNVANQNFANYDLNKQTFNDHYRTSCSYIIR